MTERLPAPASSFPQLKPDDVERVAELLGRVYKAEGRHGSTWNHFRADGPTPARFDQHPGPRGVHRPLGVVYVGVHLANRRGQREALLKTCVAEAFQGTRVIDLSRGKPWFVVFEPVRPLRLLNLADSSWVTRAGGNAALTSGPRDMARRWAKAIHGRYRNEIDGLLYQSSVLPSAYIAALWEGAATAFPPSPRLHRPLSEPDFRADLEAYASDLTYELLP